MTTPDETERVVAKLAAVRVIADRWAETPNDYDEDTEQRIEDGWALRVLLDADEPFDLDELPARTLRLRRMADAARRGVPFDEAEYEDGYDTVIETDWGAFTVTPSVTRDTSGTHAGGTPK